MILVEALDHVEAMYAAETAVDLHLPLLAAPATGDVRSSGNARLLEGQLAVNSPDPRLAVALPHARVARAADIGDGDLLLAGAGRRLLQHPLHRLPRAFPPVVRLRRELSRHGARRVVVLSQGDPWESCDPWPADDRLLIVSAQRLTDRPLEE